MNLYFELLKKPVFKVEDVNEHYGNINSARSAINRLVKQGMAIKIRNNMYTCINGETGAPVANRYQIASHISNTSYVSHHSAMEYYGMANQVYYEVYVSTQTSFRNFEFDGYRYCCLISKNMNGVVKPPYKGGIRITDLERTIIDIIKDVDKVSGAEEVIQSLTDVIEVQEDLLLRYLGVFDNQFLYQKVGFLLSNFAIHIALSKNFYDLCKERAGKSKRYLLADERKGIYDNEWKLVIPERILALKDGIIEDIEI